MTMQFMKVVGNIAYVLDTERGVVLRLPVEDYAGGIDTDEPTPIIPQRPRPMVGEESLPDDLPPTRPTVRRKNPQSIMPPGMRGIFLPQGAPGADTESRVV